MSAARDQSNRPATRVVFTERDAIEGRIPSHDLDAEAAVLSAVLLEPKTMPAIIDTLFPFHFFSEAHRQIYEAAVWCCLNKQPIDTTTVGSRLKDQQRLGQVGGMPYLGEILDASPSTSATSVRAYLSVIIEKYQLRQIALLGRRTAFQCYGPIESVQQLANDFAQAAAEIVRMAPGKAVEGNLERLRFLVSQIRKVANGMGDADANRRGLPTGIHSYDAHTLGLFPGQKHTIAALPGRGKSTIGQQIARNVAGLGVLVAVFSPEMTHEEYTERELASLARVDSRRVRQALQKPTLDAEEWRRIVQAMDPLEKLRSSIFVYDDPSMTVEDIAAETKRLSETSVPLHGMPLGLVVVDHLHRLKASRVVEFKKRNEQIAHATKALKVLAKQAKVPIIELAQAGKPEKGKQAKPHPGCIFGSAEVEQEADNVTYLWRPDEKKKRDMLAIVTKVRQGGSEGEFWLTFEGEFSTFVDPNAPNPMACPSRQYVDPEPEERHFDVSDL